ncbi:MAG: hypothetical protein EOP85_10455 [Verrucomicrobiaceae bacterium]|nr:MAG: hypothetical protein EOP85_10455 [Verrucomicrobiaceae bacterium]
MTYRKLFFVLLGTASLVVAGAAWSSHHTVHGVRVESRLFLIVGELEQSSLSIFAVLSDAPRPGVSYKRRPTDWVTDPYKDFWKVGVERFRVDHAYNKASHYYMVHVPLWLAYVVFIPLAYGACSLMERRAGRNGYNPLGSE